MTEEKLVSLMNEGRLVAACDNVIYPLIQLFIANRVNQAAAKFRAGKYEFTADIAYVAALQDLETSLKTKQSQGNKAFETLHKK